MAEKKVVVGLAGGLEARPVAVLVQIAGKYASNVVVEYKGRKVNAKSIMGMMSLGIAKGEEITICAEGADADAAIKGMEEYLTVTGE